MIPTPTPSDYTRQEVNLGIYQKLENLPKLLKGVGAGIFSPEMQKTWERAFADLDDVFMQTPFFKDEELLPQTQHGRWYIYPEDIFGRVEQDEHENLLLSTDKTIPMDHTESETLIRYSQACDQAHVEIIYFPTLVIAREDENENALLIVDFGKDLFMWHPQRIKYERFEGLDETREHVILEAQYSKIGNWKKEEPDIQLPETITPNDLEKRIVEALQIARLL